MSSCHKTSTALSNFGRGKSYVELYRPARHGKGPGTADDLGAGDHKMIFDILYLLLLQLFCN